MPAPTPRRILIASGLAAASLALSACQQDSPFGEQQTEATVLVASPAYSQGNSSAQAQIRSLQAALDRLRAQTSSGWTGRQDDVTGYLADLSGGRYSDAAGADGPALAAAFMDAHGLDLFGVTADSLAIGEASGEDVTGAATIRADQVVGGVPVLDGQLVFTIDDPDTAAALTAVRGRVFPDVDVETDAGIGAARATRLAERLTGGRPSGEPRLVILSEGTGTLVWEVTILGSSPGQGTALGDGRYYLDARSGDLVTVRPTTAEGRRTGLSPAKVRRLARTAAAAADPNSVEISGRDVAGADLSAVGVQTQDGVALVDTTVPTYDDASGDGAIVTYTAQDTENLPGRLYVERPNNGTAISDPEAIAAHTFSRVVYDYYASLGRPSWDGAGGTLLSTVNYGDSSFCNSFFNGEQMIYGNPCADESGPAELTEVDVDTAGHEITHGVINTSAGLVYSGQSGALNESFADYFGNVIGNGYKGTDSAAVFEGSCEGIESETSMCRPNPEGFSLRYLLNGATYDDYLRLINPSFRYGQMTGYDADNGGVHLNSAVWNNALWSIRSRLAQIDGTSGNESGLATDFDKIVYAALTTQLSPASDFFDARASIERTAIDAGADPTIVDVAREVFDLNKICEGCSDVGTVNGSVVSAAPQTQIEPAVSGDRFAWVDLSRGEGVGIGLAASGRAGGDPSSLGTTAETTQVVFAGEATVTLDLPGLGNRGRIVRYDPDGTSSVLAETGFATVLSGLAGSAEGAAWAANDEGTISFVDPAGEVTTADLPNLGGDTITSLGTGDGLVAFGTEQGVVGLWEPGGDFTQVGEMPGTVFSVATKGSRVFAVDDAQAATLFSGGSAIQVSSTAGRFGAALNDDYAVWSEAVGSLGGSIAEELGGATDTDLYLYSLSTGTIYSLLAQAGQQGYPAISGDRLVWQDTVFGNNDVFTATLPSGL